MGKYFIYSYKACLPLKHVSLVSLVFSYIEHIEPICCFISVIYVGYFQARNNWSFSSAVLLYEVEVLTQKLFSVWISGECIPAWGAASFSDWEVFVRVVLQVFVWTNHLLGLHLSDERKQKQNQLEEKCVDRICLFLSTWKKWEWRICWKCIEEKRRSSNIPFGLKPLDVFQPP